MSITKKQLSQFAKYQLGGLLYFVAAWVIITFGTKYIGLWWSNLIGNGFGIGLNYLVQRYITFAGKKGGHNTGGWRFVILTVVNLLMGCFLLKVQVSLGVPLWLAQFVNAGFFTVWNWVWYKYWVFKEGA
jgi:putative flippase GtrA